MKKKLSYRDKLIELANIYNVKEIQDYVKRRKNLTTGQIELILKKNKIVIPKEFNTNFFKENITKPIFKLKTDIIDFREEKIRDKNRFFRRVQNFKYDTSRKVNNKINNFWKGIETSGTNFFNVLPKLGSVVAKFFGELLTDIFNAIYNQQIDPKSARNVIIGFFAIVSLTTATFVGFKEYKGYTSSVNKVEEKEKKRSKKTNS